VQEQVLTFSKEEKEKLEIYSSLLKNWQKKFNLVSSASLMDIWQRHFVDSAQLYSLLPKEKKGAVVYDIGSGAGFPGMVLAIMGRKDMVLCESSRKKCKFLEEIKRQTQTEVIIDNIRAEMLPSQTASAIIARAVTSLSELLNLTAPLLKEKGLCIFPKGVNWKKELILAENFFNIEYDLVKSRTSKESNIFVVHSIEKKNGTK